MRKAGWGVWLAADIEGSFEEGPPTLIDAAKRDRRWCQGNLQHGWLLTSGVAQANSVFAEKLNPKNRYQYWFKGAWKDMEHRTETILVKGAAPVTHEVARTVHGPVIQWDSANNVAFSHSFAMRGREIDNWVGIVEMGRARSIDEFEAKGVDHLVLLKGGKG